MFYYTGSNADCSGTSISTGQGLEPLLILLEPEVAWRLLYVIETLLLSLSGGTDGGRDTGDTGMLRNTWGHGP